MVNIIDNRKKDIKFKAIFIGNAFVYANEVFIKYDTNFGYSLKDTKLLKIDPESLCTIVKIDIIVND